jgi:hypothetical protein
VHSSRLSNSAVCARTSPKTAEFLRSELCATANYKAKQRDGNDADDFGYERSADSADPAYWEPPPGSKLAAANEYGIDLTLLVESLELTPTERLHQLAKAQPLMEELRRVRKTLRRG